MTSTSPAPKRADGFTLLELMVVVIIIGVIATLAVLSLGDSGARRLEEEAFRFSSLLRLAADEAVLEGREIGLEVKQDSYAFHVFDDQVRQWTPLSTEAIFRRRKMRDGVELTLTLDDQEFELPTADDDSEGLVSIKPQILLLSSGETTPFELTLELRDLDKAVVLRGLGNGDIEMLAGDDR